MLFKCNFLILHSNFYLLAILDQNYTKTKSFLMANPSLRTNNFDLNDVFNTVEHLKLKNYSIADIIERPTILQLNKSTLVNRAKILEVCL